MEEEDGCLWVNLVSLFLGLFRRIGLSRRKGSGLSSTVPKVEATPLSA